MTAPGGDHGRSGVPGTPFGYRPERDADALVVRRPGGSLVAAFGAGGRTRSRRRRPLGRTPADAPDRSTARSGRGAAGYPSEETDRGQEGYRQPEERTLADLMVGHRIVLRHAVGPEPDPEDPGREVTGHLQAKTGAYWLHAVSHQGLEISREVAGEAAEIFLVPWGGVLVLNGVPRGELEEEARRRFAIDRQKLLDRLNDPHERDVNLGLNARRFLGFNPYDEEVRAALGRLPRECLYPF